MEVIEGTMKPDVAEDFVWQSHVSMAPRKQVSGHGGLPLLEARASNNW